MLLVRSDHDDLLAAARAASNGAFVGPTDERGWTTVYSLVEDEISAGFDTWVHLDDERRDPCLRARSADVVQELVWFWDEEELWKPTGDVPAMARLLVALFGEGADHAMVVDLLAAPGDDDWLMWDLADVLRLPELQEPGPEQAVVVVRAPREDLLLAAAIAGPARLVDVGHGWWALAPESGSLSPDHDPAWDLGHAVAAMTNRKAPVLYVGRRGAEHSVHVVTRREHLPAAGWDLRWERSDDDSGERYAALTSRLGEAPIPAHARALLRRRSAPDGLALLFTMFGVPTEVASLLDDSERWSYGELVERSSARRAWWSAVRDASTTHDDPASVRREWFRLCGGAFGFLFEGTVAAFLVAMAVTNGAMIDEGPLSTSDVWFLAVVTPIAVASMVWCAWAARRAAARLIIARRDRTDA
ncbi:hypothetical protein [Cellulomonas sp. PhB150]|uniref:hypothetical protein n=1 Tax=Cellulomonas sp. PhB150 TaxID=2485188 RepID=UPI000F4A0D8D|nr:hypothetical protein [Cellulomonas sp. PhB150]ROS30534.1 hypothetical protein EDF34_0172 [Cellulomonas sp. PhB150]